MMGEQDKSALVCNGSERIVSPQPPIETNQVQTELEMSQPCQNNSSKPQNKNYSTS